MTYTRAWDESLPLGSALSASDIDGEFRRLKLDLRERLDAVVYDWTTDPVVLRSTGGGGVSDPRLAEIMYPNTTFDPASLKTPSGGIYFPGVAGWEACIRVSPGSDMIVIGNFNVYPALNLYGSTLPANIAYNGMIYFDTSGLVIHFNSLRYRVTAVSF